MKDIDFRNVIHILFYLYLYISTKYIKGFHIVDFIIGSTLMALEVFLFFEKRFKKNKQIKNKE